MNWNDAIDYSNNLSLGNAGCGSSHTDWRLPNITELQSLIDFSNYGPALPTSHPFSNVQSSVYWSSITSAFFSASAWFVTMYDGDVNDGLETSFYGYVWPVRSEN